MMHSGLGSMVSRSKDLGMKGVMQYFSDVKNLFLHLVIGSAAGLLALFTPLGIVGAGLGALVAEVLLIGKASEIGLMD